MFGQTFVNAQTQTRKPWMVALSAALQTLLVAALLIAPLLRVASLGPLPKPSIWLPVEKLDLRMKPQPPASAAHSATIPRSIFHAPTLQAPTSVPRRIDMTPDAPSIATSFGAAGTTAAGLTDFLPAIAAPPIPKPVPPAAPSRPAAPVHIGGDVQAANLIFGPRPTYPTLARATRTQGTVRIQATIARDGSIGNLQVLSGPPLLVEVALDAVRQWRYRPTMLNGAPVEVLTEIAVNFTLGNQ